MLDLGGMGRVKGNLSSSQGRLKNNHKGTMNGH